MDGRTLEAGAVAYVRGIKNPVDARAAGNGALAARVLARRRRRRVRAGQGMELVAPEYF